MLRRPIPRFHPVIFALLLLVWASSTLAGQQPVEYVAVEEVRIGSVDDPDASLSSFRTVAIGPHEQIYIPQETSGEVRRYDSQGQFLDVFGGKGEGPGEFQSISTMGWVGDTLWVHDRGLRRISFFSAEGVFLLSRIFVPEGLEVPFVPGTVLSVASSGNVTAQLGVFSRAVAEGLVETLPVIVTDSLGETKDTLAVLPISRGDHGIRMPNGWVFARRQPWGDDPLWSSTPAGTGFYRVDRRAPEKGDLVQFTVKRLDFGGNEIFGIAATYRPQPLSSDLVDLYVSRLAEGLVGTDGPTRLFKSKRQAEEAIRESLFAPDYIPPVSGLVAGRDGSAWLRRENTLEDSTVWEIVDPHGQVVKSIVLPTAATVLQADQDHAWVRVSDEFDIPYLVRYRIEPKS